MAFRGDAGFTNETEFHTVVAGPGSIRFAYRELPTEFSPAELTELVVSDGNVRSYHPWASEPLKEVSLEMGVAGMTGISQGLVVDVLPLLPIGLHVHSALDVQGARWVGVAEIEGETCDEIEAYVTRALPPPTRVRIWIAQSDSLIRRISRDLVATAEQMAAISNSAEAALRDAGLPTIEDPFGPHPLSTFDLTTFQPTCNEPVSSEALRATDGSL